MSLDLDGLLALRDLDRPSLMTRLGAGPECVEENVRYERLRPVDRLHVPAAHPSYFYFDDDRLVMIYTGPEAVRGVHPAVLAGALGEPEAELRSRAGEGSSIRVYPSQGIAFSSDGDDVEFLEVFPPTTLDRYEREIYEDPGEFIR